MDLNKAVSRILATVLSVALLLTQTGITAYGSEVAGLGASGTEQAEGGDLALGISAAGGIAPASFGVYNAGDVAIINGIIDSQPGLAMYMTKWDSGITAPPSDWDSVEWSNAPTDKRVEKLRWGGIGLTGGLNVTGLSGLQYLDCGINQLTGLNVTGLSNLEYLDCSNNQLTSLNVTGLSNLRELYCFNNQLTGLNVSGLNALVFLYCDGNQLTSLNINGLANLQNLDCSHNRLTGLNVANLPNLHTLYCNDNQLTGLDVSTLSSLIDLLCHDNPLQYLTLQNSYTVSMTINGSGSVMLTSYNNYASTSIIEYQATPDAGFGFAGWESSDLSISDPTNSILNFIMPAGRNVSVTAVFGAEYNQGDVDAINAIIDAHPELGMTRWDSGYTPPSNWGSVSWSTTATDKRVEELWWGNVGLTGSLDVTGLESLEALYCDDNQLTGLNVSNLNSLANFQCNDNPLLDFTLEDGRTVKVNVPPGHSVWLDDYNHATGDFQYTATAGPGGFSFSQWQVTPSSLATSSLTSPTLTFNMPAGNVEITALFTSGNYNAGDIAVVNGIIDSQPGLSMTRWDSGPTPPSDWNGLVIWSTTSTDDRVTALYWDSENLTGSLDVTGLPNLQRLYCSNNQLTSLDVSTLSSLTDLACYNNPLLDLTLQDGRTVSITVDGGGSVMLTVYTHASTPTVQYQATPDAGLVFAGWESSDLSISDSVNTHLDFIMPASGNVGITAVFVAEYNQGDVDAINAIIDSQPELGMTRWDSGNNPPSDWSSVHWSTTGTDDRVTELHWDSKNLTGSLDVTGLSNLQRLYCSYNQLTGLDVSNLSNLQTLYCSDNQLTSLDVSTLSSLTDLLCINNPLLDFTLQNGRTISVTIDGGGSVMLTDYIHALIPDIGYQAIPDAGLVFAGWESSDISISDPADNYLYFTMPASGNVGITAAFGIEYNQGDVDAINAIIDAHPELGMTKWTSGPTPPSDWNNYVGWSSTAADRRVQGLWWVSMGLTGSLDVTGLSDLRELYCFDNQLTGLNLTGLSDLHTLSCYDNQLTGLNVTGLGNLQYLDCNNNQLTGLNVTGLGNLQYLDCNNNQLTGLNVTGLGNLQYLYCYSNQLTSLNVTGLSNLEMLGCHANQLTGLDLTGLTNLQLLFCYDNQLTGLDVSNLSSLIELRCHDNPVQHFTLQDGRTVRVAVSGSGSILLTGYDHDAATPYFEYRAIPGAGTGFSRWEGSGIQIANPTNHDLNFTMPTGGNVNLTAVFSTGGAADTLTLGALSDDTVTIGYNYRKTVSYSYSGSDTVSFQVTGLPAGLTFDSATGIISGVPTDAAGQYPVQITVTAGGLSDSGGYTLTLTTTATAASLTMEPLSDETVTAGNPYTRLPAYTYIGPDTLAYSATGLPTGLSIDSATGRISGTPTVAGAYDITATVREETGSLSASQGYRLTVTGGSSGSSSSGRSSSGSSGDGSSTPDSARAKTQLPASAFSWDGGRTLTIDHDGITPLGLLSVRWDGETLVRGTDYTVHSGSVILRFGEDFIAGQRDGNHTVRVEFANHTGEYTLSLGGAAAGSTGGTEQSGTGGDIHNPQTGDFDASPWWWMMALLPAAALTFGSAALIWRRLRQAKEV